MPQIVMEILFSFILEHQIVHEFGMFLCPVGVRSQGSGLHGSEPMLDFFFSSFSFLLQICLQDSTM